jgi:1-acyl-sn-glycerol-3-phosphate acyltransferase
MDDPDAAPRSRPGNFIRVLHYLMSWMGRVEVHGVEHLAGTRGMVVVCNHVGWADPLWVGYAAYPHMLHQMAKKELFEIPGVAWFVRSGGGFPVDRGRPKPATIKHAIGLVERGELLLIFPAGTRGREDGDSKRGAATIALRAGAAIVPAHYAGPDRMRVAHLWRRPRIRVQFGAPLPTHEFAGNDKSTALRVTAALDAAMQAVRPESAAPPAPAPLQPADG